MCVDCDKTSLATPFDYGTVTATKTEHCCFFLSFFLSDSRGSAIPVVDDRNPGVGRARERRLLASQDFWGSQLVSDYEQVGV